MAMNPRMSVSGFTETVENLRTYSRQMQQNIERKAMRQTMNKQKAWQKVAWRNYPVQKSSLEWGKGKIKTYKSGRQKLVRSYSIRKETAKALTVKVGTTKRAAGLNKSAKFIVYGRLFLNYKKLKAGRARLAHLLEYSHRVGDTQTTTTPKQPTAINFRKRSGRYRDMYLRAVLAWVHSPKMTQKQARSFLS